MLQLFAQYDLQLLALTNDSAFLDGKQDQLHTAGAKASTSVQPHSFKHDMIDLIGIGIAAGR